VVVKPTWIDKAGAFKVSKLPAPVYREAVNLDFPRTGVLHTTEGGWRGAFGILSTHYSPHFMLGWNETHSRAEIGQYLPVGVSGHSCRGHNDDVLVQIELIGFAEETKWLPGQTKRNPHPETLDALCSLMNVCWHEWGIPLVHPFKDGDFGLAGSSRRNTHRKAGKFGKIAGWYGHGDMPDPDVHWDPGALEWSKVFLHCHELEAAVEVA
jgi:hypothetical protein